MGSRVVRCLSAWAPRHLGLCAAGIGSRQCGLAQSWPLPLLDGARGEPIGAQTAGSIRTRVVEAVDSGYTPALTVASSPLHVGASCREDSPGQTGMRGTALGWHQQQLRYIGNSSGAIGAVLLKKGLLGALSPDGAGDLPAWKETFDHVKRRDNSAEIGYVVAEQSSMGQVPGLAEYLQSEEGGPLRSQAENVDVAEDDVDSDEEGKEPEVGTVVPAPASSTELAHAGERHVRRRPVFAVVQVGSHQFKVSPGDSIYSEKLLFADVNDVVHLNKVLLLGSRYETVIGRPTIRDAHVVALVEEQALEAKVIVFKKKRRKNYRRHRGHRQHLTRLLILDVVGIQDAPG